MTTIYTVGHGTRTLAEFMEAVRAASVDKIIDVRRFPGSRRHPHFSREALEASLPSHGIEYEMWGEVLGGRRHATGSESRHPAWRNDSFRAYADHMDREEFQRALDELERAAAQTALAVMCAERLWWNCHRRLIADALTLRGHDVVHVVDATTRQPHKLHENVRADPAGLAVYDVGVTAELDLDPVTRRSTVPFAAVAAQVRPGEWTTYGDISTAARGDPRWARAVGNEAANSDGFPTPHRVLGHGGVVTRGSESSEVDRARSRLEGEGVRFISGRADPTRRVHWDELARRAGVAPARGKRLELEDQE